MGFGATGTLGKTVPRPPDYRGAASQPALIVDSLFQGSPAGDLEQIDRYLEALLQEDNPPFQNALNKVTADAGHGLRFERNRESKSEVRKDNPF